MTEWNDLDRDDDGAQFFRGVAGPVAVPFAGARASGSNERASATCAGPCCRPRRTLRRLSGARRRVEQSVGWRTQARRTGTDPRTRSRRGQRLDTHTQRESTVAVCGCRCCGRAADGWHRARLAVPSRGACSVNPQVAAKVPRPAAPSVFQLEKPAIRPPAPGDLLWRGSGKPAPSDDLARAFEALGRNDFAEAERRLQALVLVNHEARRLSSIWA